MKQKNRIFIIISLIIILIIILLLNATIYEKFEINEDETTCIYVSSHGIKKSCNSIENCIYIKSDSLNDFIIPDKPFILVTGDEDATIPDDFDKKTNEILNSSNLIHWYSQNLNHTTNPKLSSIPIGLDYHTIANGKKDMSWWGKQETPKKQEEIIFKLKNTKFNERIPKLYINFANSIRGKYGEKDRRESLEQIPKNLQIIEKNNIPRNETWTNMSKYTFVLSPHGNGLDCHRTWEALALACIPVVKKSSLDVLYQDLPVLIVDDWSDINEELLNSTIEIFEAINFNYDKLTLDYWINKINNNNNNNSLKVAIFFLEG
jgi:hypothetical protein